MKKCFKILTVLLLISTLGLLLFACNGDTGLDGCKCGCDKLSCDSECGCTEPNAENKLSNESIQKTLMKICEDLGIIEVDLNEESSNENPLNNAKPMNFIKTSAPSFGEMNSYAQIFESEYFIGDTDIGSSEKDAFLGLFVGTAYALTNMEGFEQGKAFSEDADGFYPSEFQNQSLYVKITSPFADSFIVDFAVEACKVVNGERFLYSEYARATVYPIGDNDYVLNAHCLGGNEFDGIYRYIAIGTKSAGGEITQSLYAEVSFSSNTLVSRQNVLDAMNGDSEVSYFEYSLYFEGHMNGKYSLNKYEYGEVFAEDFCYETDIALKIVVNAGVNFNSYFAFSEEFDGATCLEGKLYQWLNENIYKNYREEPTQFIFAEYEVDLSGLDNIGSVIDNILDLLFSAGYTEARVQTKGENGIIIEIPNQSDTEILLSLIGSPAKLEFKDDSGTVVISGEKHLLSAETIYDYGNYAISLSFNSLGTLAFAEATANNIGKSLDIYINDEKIMSPTVNSQITDGKAVIVGNYSYSQASELATKINAGAFGARLTLIKAGTVSPT
ncbi:MAG: hypothetical protein FWD49_05685 [Firmicutes bacterium]|nr:hypothetical protein [Bacillota bacterium]